MLSQHLWPPHATPPSITSFQTQTFLQLIDLLAVLRPEIHEDWNLGAKILLCIAKV